jgi:hypothetical protein
MVMLKLKGQQALLNKTTPPSGRSNVAAQEGLSMIGPVGMQSAQCSIKV